MDYDFSKVAEATKTRIDAGILPGAILAINIKGETVFYDCQGFSNVEKKIPLKRNNLFRLASMTKPITAIATLIAEERGLLKITDNISKYLPEFKDMYIGVLNDKKEVVKSKKADKEITIEDILTHSSGLGSGVVGDLQYNNFAPTGKMTLKDTVHGYSKMLLDFSPATSQLYSPTVALDICCRIIEITSGMDYEKYLQKFIFQPLNMKDTTYKLDDEKYSRVVDMYRLSDDVKYIENIENKMGRCGFQDYLEGYTGGTAGLFSTIDDYMNFAIMLRNEGEFEGKRIVSKEAIRRMRTPHFEIGFAGMNEYFNWGYAVRVVQKVTENVQMLSCGSYGWSGAYNTHFWIDPKLELCAVYMSNMDNSGGSGAITAFEFECNTMRAIGEK